VVRQQSDYKDVFLLNNKLGLRSDRLLASNSESRLQRAAHHPKSLRQQLAALIAFLPVPPGKLPE